MKNMKKKPAAKAVKLKGRVVVLANERFGLYYGRITCTDASIATTRSARVEGCRHISQWYSVPGGITSLAKHGPQAKSRIGAPCSALLTGLVNVFDISPEAAALFDAMAPSA